MPTLRPYFRAFFISVSTTNPIDSISPLPGGATYPSATATSIPAITSRIDPAPVW